MKRQQLVLTAIRRQFDPLAMLPRMPQLLDIAADNLYTTFGRDEIPLLAQVAARVDADLINQATFHPTRAGDFSTVLDADEIRGMRSQIRGVFEGEWPDPTPTPSGLDKCPPKS
jgi:anionic cell wall polymer biosynthesis LytR-Cps2A-Psr (LCP) family protein